MKKTKSIFIASIIFLSCYTNMLFAEISSPAKIQSYPLAKTKDSSSNVSPYQNQKIKFCVVYQFDVDKAHEAEFLSLWHKATLVIRDRSGGLGSRLHKVYNKPCCYVAYAQWPNREAWLNRTPPHSLQERMIQQSQKLAKLTTVYELEMVDDLLVKD